TQNSRHRYAASTSGNPSFSVLRQLQFLCELAQGEESHEATAKRPGLVRINRVFNALDIHMPDP
ncbi:DUF5431 family protein, partial [Klebsiella pneumoniae]|uniref:DUF5431 family protein n=2 Tax=Klebsiella pneumoniae TaxID=573 RepID=UPI001F4EAA48